MLWKTIDGGQTFSLVNNNLPALGYPEPKFNINFIH